MQPQQVSVDVLQEKYAKGAELTEQEIFRRVAKGVASVESAENKEKYEEIFYQNMVKGAIGAGRIMSAAGVDIAATLINCFVQPVGDSIRGNDADGVPGIYDALAESAETMRRGGGVGYNFSRIRPKGATVGKVGSLASGPCSYMNVFDQSCKTVESAGARRGAQMGILNIDHPDIEDFIVAKRTPERWNNFNVSVFVTDSFMEAKNTGKDIELVHKAKPGKDIMAAGAYQREDGLWVYKTVSAAALWDTIMTSNYDFAEPGILFPDTINSDNNLRYVETIEATNPCAEQPLPPYGCCDLGPIILSKFVKNPFTSKASFDYKEFGKAVAIQVRFLDNVLDATLWPLKEQHQESMSKRRIGIGYTGLANALAMLNVGYASEEGLVTARCITEIMRDQAYIASSNLAVERGSFGLFDAVKYFEEGTFASNLPPRIKTLIRKQGIRNSHLLSIAPTGTISLAFADNASNGIEPPFSLVYTRKKRVGDDFVYYKVIDHGFRVYLSTLDKVFADALLEAVSDGSTIFTYSGGEVVVADALPVSLVTAQSLTAHEHLSMLKAVQPFIDTSISKTVNVPEDYPYEDFKAIYDKAWEFKLKGVSTYRPNSILGSVLSITPPKEEAKPETKVPDVKHVSDQLANTFITKRPSGTLPARIKKVEYLTSSFISDNFYVGVSFVCVDEIDTSISIVRPIEVFFTVCPDGVPQEWMDSLAIGLSLLARGGLDLLCKTLRAYRKVKSDKGQIRYGWYIKADGSKVPRFHSSEVACMSFAIQEILVEEGLIDALGFPNEVKASELATDAAKPTADVTVKETPAVNNSIASGKLCQECGASAVIKKDGCEFCTNCGSVGSCG